MYIVINKELTDFKIKYVYFTNLGTPYSGQTNMLAVHNNARYVPYTVHRYIVINMELTDIFDKLCLFYQLWYTVQWSDKHVGSSQPC